MRFFATAMTGLLLFGSTALAEPPNAEPKGPTPQSQPKPQPAQIVLASAEPLRVAPDAVAAPIKRRVAPRVTTCRCGDQPATPQRDER